MFATLYQVPQYEGMSAGQLPIVEAFSNGRGAHRLVEAINNWLSARKVDSDSQSA